ncbi:MAG: GntR family transcriptional regulator [Rhodobiaceae bacterium]|nr:GntR family transcriptional regulator [Rhodobiaceae bacterium]MCC0013600.1 GntR family transcriptional regulator [Rhodobiaceae bacterium]MCC0018286.1 GntR family transcriptional regulator [Rhodobiaceae bacterium]MCC0060605.1 GntR family transcriptional regulator [Rhodobiaceae bacterium]
MAAVTSKTNAYEQLKTSILTLCLQPGADLDEASLSERYGLSRTPLREVLRELAGEGYVELRENRGARVSDMSFTTLREFFLAAPMIYGAILQLAAINRTPVQIADLKSAQRDFVVALQKGSVSQRTLANNRFHEITGEMAGNVYLLPSFKRLLIDHARIGMTFYKPSNNAMAEKLSEASEQHDAIIAAIEAGDEKRAAQLAEMHWNLSRGQIEMFVTPAGIEGQLGFAGENNDKKTA